MMNTWTPAFRSSDFVNTPIITDQIGRYSVHFPLLIENTGLTPK